MHGRVPDVILVIAQVTIGVSIGTQYRHEFLTRLLRLLLSSFVTVPFALLVPFVGSASSSLVFGETFGPLRLAGMLIVVGGIAVMLLAKRPQALAKIA